MQLPARNVYYLLCYAWNWLEARRLVEASAVRSDRLLDLLAFALGEAVSHALRRGLDRDYLAFDEDTRAPRGKIDVAGTIARAVSLDGRLHCVMDDLSYDILHNRLVAATLERLPDCDLDPKIARRIRLLYRRFPRISTIELSAAPFRRVRLHRNNHHYRFILNLCELIVRFSIPEKGGGWTFHDFSASPQEMGLLFQNFVRRFLEREQRAFSVSAPIVPWDTAESTNDEWLPQMRTDVCLTTAGREVIVEVKYPQSVLEASQGGRPKLNSSHLYQLLAYLRARRPRQRETVGVLLYASEGQTLDFRYVIGGYPVLVRAVDLARPWQDIHVAMLRLVGDLLPSGGRERA